jgi:hypothetical protein
LTHPGIGVERAPLRLVMTVRGDPGEEPVVYSFKQVGLAATPVP